MKATLELRERLPEAASCFVEPRNEAVMLNGALRLSAYLPWGRALRRGEAEPERRFYGGEAIMRELRSCEGQPAVQAMSQQASYSWCRGCPMSLTFGILQSIVVQRPYEARGRNIPEAPLRALLSLCFPSSPREPKSRELSIEGVAAVSTRHITCIGNLQAGGGGGRGRGGYVGGFFAG